MQRPVLLPVPRSVVWESGSVTRPAQLVVVLTAWSQELLTVARGLGAVEIAASPAGPEGQIHAVVERGTVGHPQGYRLTVGGGRFAIVAETAEGAAYGLATLKQLLAGSGRQVPCVTIADHPDFGRRGVMLDISRGKVPTMASLCRFVDMLADLKVNEFQLYTEHTFAYRNHREAWQNYSPMTGQEILLLDRYCRERFIDLVPNQNSFGHMKEWLVHERYAHLAEQTTGWTAWGTFHPGPFSLCPLEPAVIPFLGELYDELLPHFSSPYFNVGCDETFDVGQGRSKEAVEQFGEHRVYVDQLKRIYDLVKARGKTMQFWGDIVIKAPEYLEELPRDLVALEWGYEANHPFDEHCGHYARAGMPFYVCPGTSTWNSLVGRTDNAIGNLLGAAEAGLKHGAIGYLNTIWGDRGHQDYEPVTYLPIAFGAAVSWAVEPNRTADVRPYLDQLIFGDRAGEIGKLLYDLGNVYQAPGKLVGNGSLLINLLHFGVARPQVAADRTAADWDRTAEAIRAIAVRIDHLDLTGQNAGLVGRELQNSVRLLLHMCEYAKLRLTVAAGEPVERARVVAQALDLDAIVATHRDLWLERNRIGGLDEMGLVPFRTLRGWYQELLDK